MHFAFNIIFYFKFRYETILSTNINNYQKTILVNSRDKIEDIELKMLLRNV